MSNKVQKLRTALEKKPALLRNLAVDMLGRPPLILGPWEPDLQVAEARLVVHRRDIFGRPVLYVAPETRKGKQGPWEVEVYGSYRRFMDHQTIQDLEATSSELWESYTPSLNAVDRTLTDLGWHLTPHKFHDVVFGPWMSVVEDTWVRPILHADTRMAQNFAVTIKKDLGGKDKYHWRQDSVNSFIEDSVADLRTAMHDCDTVLIEQGYNLARPESFTVAGKKTLSLWTQEQPGHYVRRDENGNTRSVMWADNDGWITWGARFTTRAAAWLHADRQSEKAGWTLT